MAPATEHRSAPPLDDESRGWLAALRGHGHAREEAIARLHELLLRAARFEIARRRSALPHLRGGDLDDIAVQSANDALVALLAKLDSFRGDSRFTTWAYKFALLEAAVKLRRRDWQNRELVIEPERWPTVAAEHTSSQQLEARELLAAIRRAVQTELTPHQREVFTALALNEIPIDVLAERLATTRGALYKTLHDARRKLRAELDRSGLSLHARNEPH